MDPETRERLFEWKKEAGEVESRTKYDRKNLLTELRSIVEEAGSQSAVARELGITRQALNERLRKEE